MPTEQPLIELVGIAKRFGGVVALEGVDFSLMPGEIHGLVGENGAGKSTLMKIIAGVHTEYDGEMRVQGRKVHFRSARDALDAGIGMVHQELSIAPNLSVAENLELAAALLKVSVRERLPALYELFPDLARQRKLPAARLSGGQRQMLAMARALVRMPQVLLGLLVGAALSISGVLFQALLRHELARRDSAQTQADKTEQQQHPDDVD